MKYLFILGRNIDLSVAEVICYLEKTGNPILNYSLHKNGMLIEVKRPIVKIVDDLGGTVAIGEVLAEGNLNNELEKIMIYAGTKNNINYLLWDFNKEGVEEIAQYLKQRFKSEKLKAVEKKFDKKVLLQDEEIISSVSSRKLIDEQYFVFGDKVFGRITQKCDYKNLENRDMNKPVRRELLSISPRLAKIMINLSQTKRGEVLLDPFCGIGVVLQEALLQRINVIGIDKDKSAITGTRQNLNWFGFSDRNYKLFNRNSTSQKVSQIDGIATEPHLGEVLKKIPQETKARKMILDFENLIVNVLNNVKKGLKDNGRIVFTTPYIKTIKKRIGCDVENIIQKTGLRLIEIKGIENPIPEFRKNQVVGREIVVLEK